ncbi:MAG: hypothetical protein EOM19_01915 [Candidatus Moranbacteria bacterium]|nr:hypothetical protein [Candidatus Moranbacteria bacterium]
MGGIFLFFLHLKKNTNLSPSKTQVLSFGKGREEKKGEKKKRGKERERRRREERKGREEEKEKPKI